MTNSSMSVEQRLNDHIEENNRRFNHLDNKFNMLVNTHLANIQNDIKEMRDATRSNTQTLEAMKRGVWFIAAPIFGGLGIGLINLMR